MKKYLQKEIKSIDQKQGIVKFYANAFGNVDSDGDVSLQGSFTKTLKDNLGRMRWLLNHDTDILLGVPFIDGGIEDNFGLLATNKFNMEKKISQDTFEDYKIYADYGRSLEHSIRVQAVPKKYEVFEGDAIPKEYRDEAYNKGFDRIRVVKEWQMWEITTMLTWGSNPRTPMVDLKSLSEIDDTIDLLKTMLNGRYSEERLKKIDETLNILKSLTDEPLSSTRNEPENNTRIKPIDIYKGSKLYN